MVCKTKNTKGVVKMTKSIKRKTIVVLFVCLLAAVCTLCLSGCNEKSDYEQFELSNFVGDYINAAQTPYCNNMVSFDISMAYSKQPIIKAYVINNDGEWTLDFIDAFTSEKIPESNIDEAIFAKVKYFVSLFGDTCKVKNKKIVFGKNTFDIDKTWWLEREYDFKPVSVRKVQTMGENINEIFKFNFYRDGSIGQNDYNGLIHFSFNMSFTVMGKNSAYDIMVESHYFKEDVYNKLVADSSIRSKRYEVSSSCGEDSNFGYIGIKNYYLLPDSKCYLPFESEYSGKYSLQISDELLEVYVNDQKQTPNNGIIVFDYIKGSDLDIRLNNATQKRLYGQIEIDCCGELVGEHTLVADGKYLYKLSGAAGVRSFSTQNADVRVWEIYTNNFTHGGNISFLPDFILTKETDVMYIVLQNKSEEERSVNVVENEKISVSNGDIFTVSATACGGILQYKGSKAGEYMFSLNYLDSNITLELDFLDSKLKGKDVGITKTISTGYRTYTVTLKENETLYITYKKLSQESVDAKIEFSAKYKEHSE